MAFFKKIGNIDQGDTMLTKYLLMPKFLCSVHFSLGTEHGTLARDWSAHRNFGSSPDTLAVPYSG